MASWLSLSIFGSVWAAQPQAGTILWTYDAGVGIASSPALAADGTVYINTNSLLAITNNGAMASCKWAVALLTTTPIVAPDGTIYCALSSDLRAVAPNGSIRWALNLGGTSSASFPAVAADSTLYYVAGGQLNAITATGVLRWGKPVGSLGTTTVLSPVVAPDGTILVGADDQLYSFQSDGTMNWSRNLVSFGDTPLCVGSSGEVYGGAGELFAIDPTGNTLWSFKSDRDASTGSPILAQDGTCYAAVYTIAGRSLCSFTGGGQLRWVVLGGPMYGYYTTPALDAGGSIYYCVSNSIWSLTSQGQVQWRLDATADSPDGRVDIANTSPIIGSDGTLYAAIGTKLYAIATGTNGPANSPWPMYRGNAQHTGRIQKPSLQNPKKRADANFEFQLFSQTGKNVSIESSTNLTTWNTLTSVVPTIAPEPIVDLTASNSPAKFYRAKGGG